MSQLRSTWHRSAEFFNNLPHGFARLRMLGDGPPNADVVCARLNCFPRSHESFLIARFCPTWPNSLNRDLDSVAQLAAKWFDFTGTGHDSIDPGFYA